MKVTPPARMRRKLWRGRFKTVLLALVALSLAVMAFAGPAIAKALGGGQVILAQMEFDSEGSLVIGEDLGTVPDEIRDGLRAAGVSTTTLCSSKYGAIA